MTRRFPPGRPGDDRFEELENDPALAALIADARAAPVEADRGPALETALAVFRVAAAPPTVDAAPAARPTRRHRLVRAVAATTLATKVLLGVATAAALGGIGVAVTETVQHIAPRAPATTAPVSTPPPSDGPSGTGTGGGSDDPTPSGSATTSPTDTASPTTTVTDTASVGATSSASRSGSASPTGSRTSGSPDPTRSASPPPSATPQGVTPSADPDDTGDR